VFEWIPLLLRTQKIIAYFKVGYCPEIRLERREKPRKTSKLEVIRAAKMPMKLVVAVWNYSWASTFRRNIVSLSSGLKPVGSEFH
jgi:hypothetical protein